MAKQLKTVFSAVLTLSDTASNSFCRFCQFCPFLTVLRLNTPSFSVNHLNHPGPTRTRLSENTENSHFPTGLEGPWDQPVKTRKSGVFTGSQVRP